MFRNLVLTETLIVCITALIIWHGYFELKHFELSVQLELARAITKVKSSTPPTWESPQWKIMPEWRNEKSSAIEPERKL